MNQSDNISNNDVNANSSQFAFNLHAHIIFIFKNSCDYFFDMNLIFNYINKQIIYYYITSVIFIVNQI